MSSILHIFSNWDVLALCTVVLVSGAIRTFWCQYWYMMNGPELWCEHTDILLAVMKSLQYCHFIAI